MLNHIFNALQTFIISHIFLLQCNTRLSICIRLPVICLILHSLSLFLSVQRENTNRMNNAKLTLACKADPTFCLTKQSKSKSNTNICRLKLHTLVIYIYVQLYTLPIHVYICRAPSVALVYHAKSF